MYDSLTSFALVNKAANLEEADMKFIPLAVWFTDDGISLKGWINPATGQPSAIKAKPQPIIKAPKIGRNAPCPCGSGLKYKNCKCTQFHSNRVGGGD